MIRFELPTWLAQKLILISEQINIPISQFCLFAIIKETNKMYDAIYPPPERDVEIETFEEKLLKAKEKGDISQEEFDQLMKEHEEMKEKAKTDVEWRSEIKEK